VENSLTKQKNSRLGATAAIPIGKRQSLKFGYSNGTYIRYGGNYQNVSVARQYPWLGDLTDGKQDLNKEVVGLVKDDSSLSACRAKQSALSILTGYKARLSS
jgi:hypothetical protein